MRLQDSSIGRNPMHPNGNDHIVHIEDLYKAYDGKVVLDNVDLSITKGELMTVVGPSGCGKSTLLKMILHAAS
jgi:ABC-type Fe3+/spermidine/putrescine transport system ATPase subunit